jgi:hypothetical protein
VCGVPMIEIRWWPVWIKHVNLSPIWTLCCHELRGVPNLFSDPEVCVKLFLYETMCFVEPWCCIQLCLLVLYLEVWCYSSIHVGICADIVIRCYLCWFHNYICIWWHAAIFKTAGTVAKQLWSPMPIGIGPFPATSGVLDCAACQAMLTAMPST